MLSNLYHPSLRLHKLVGQENYSVFFFFASVTTIKFIKFSLYTFRFLLYTYLVSSAKYLTIIGFLSIALIASLFVVVRTTTTYQRAAGNSSGSTVLENSYLFASPLQAKADGKEMIRLTVFLLDGRGLGVANQTVTLKLPSSAVITNQQEITDQSGKAIFDISSPVAQTINVTANTGSSKLPQSVKIIFY